MFPLAYLLLFSSLLSCVVVWGCSCSQLLLSGLGQMAYPLWASPSSSEQCDNEDAHLSTAVGTKLGTRGCRLTPRKPKIGFSCCRPFFFPPDLSFVISYVTVRLDCPIFLFTRSGTSNPKSEARFCDSCDCTWALTLQAGSFSLLDTSGWCMYGRSHGVWQEEPRADSTLCGPLHRHLPLPEGRASESL